MRRIVINADYGTFRLSPEGLRLYAKKKGFELCFYRRVPGTNKLERVPDREVRSASAGGTIFKTRGDLGKLISFDTLMENPFIEIERDDPALVAAVEELGRGAADTGACTLKIVEVPDGVECGIGEENGLEWVYEVHRTWR